MPTTSRAVPSARTRGGSARIAGGVTLGDGTRGRYLCPVPHDDATALGRPRPTVRPPPHRRRRRSATTCASRPIWPPAPSPARSPSSVDVAVPTDRRWSATPPSSTSATPGSTVGGRRIDGHGRARRRPGAGPGQPARGRCPWRLGHAPPRLLRRPQRQAPRLLPLHLHRRRRRRPHHRRHPVRADRRPPGLPVLGRARLQGRLRRHARRRRRPAGDLERPRAGSRGPRRRPGAGPLRRHHADVHLPGGLRRRAAGGHRARSTSTASRCASCTARARATWPTSPSRSVRSPCASSPTTTASPTRATRSTSSPCPTSPSAPWRTWAASPSARPSCWSTPSRPPSPSCIAVVDVIAHELAHMWFGDLVTMALVERHLAERGLRHVHGDAVLRRLPARVGALDALRP